MHNPDITVTIKFNYSNNSFEVLNEEEEDEEGGARVINCTTLVSTRGGGRISSMVYSIQYIVDFHPRNIC